MGPWWEGMGLEKASVFQKMYGAAEGGELISIMHKGMVRGSIFE